MFIQLDALCNVTSCASVVSTHPDCSYLARSPWIALGLPSRRDSVKRLSVKRHSCSLNFIMYCLENTGPVLSPVSGQGQHTVLLRKTVVWHRFFGLNSVCLKPSTVFTKQKIFSSISCSYSSRPLEEAPEAARQVGTQPGLNSRWLF